MALMRSILPALWLCSLSVAGCAAPSPATDAALDAIRADASSDTDANSADASVAMDVADASTDASNSADAIEAAVADADTRADAADAADGARCIGRVQPPDGPCRCQSDCAPSATCSNERESRASGGRCLTPCAPEAPAPAGFVCVTVAGRSRLAARCDASTPCRTGWACTRENAEPHCVALCAADSECESGRCDRAVGLCGDPSTPGGAGAVGDACALSADCAGAVCLPGSGGFVGGYCSGLCRIDAEPCLGDGLCFLSAAARAMGLQVGLCVRACSSPADCRAGYRCANTGFGTACIP